MGSGLFRKIEYNRNSDEAEGKNVTLKNYKSFERIVSDGVSETHSKKTINRGQTLKANVSQIQGVLIMGDFMTNLTNALSRRGIKITDFCNSSDASEKRLLQEYGSVFLASDQLKITGFTPIGFGIMFPTFSISKVELPPKCLLDDAGVTAFQSKVKSKTATIGGTSITLQEVAMDDLLLAEAEIKKASLTLTPRGGSTAGSRTFADTKAFWDKKVQAGFDHWKGKKMGVVKFDDEAKGLLTLPIKDQVKKVLELETKGFFFSLKFDKTILQSVAAPGASQHLWLLALDIKEHADNRVSKILAQFGWFQTIQSDLPHFTYLGIAESQLGSMGLKKVTNSSQEFWVPDI